MKYSLIIPIYKNESSIDRLLKNIELLEVIIKKDLEVIFVIDGSPDRSFEILQSKLSGLAYKAKLILHSRNFGSFAAIKSGLKASDSDYSAIYSADCQEPIELIKDFIDVLEKGETDVVVGSRRSRNDGTLTRVFSNMFWRLYRQFVDKAVPKGGVDVFACNSKFKNQLVLLKESRTSLVGLIYWMGFNRSVVEYDRKPRLEGKSAWTFRKKRDYLLDSLFSFTDLPIRVLLTSGLVGMLISVILSIVVLLASLAGNIEIPGYSPTILVILFFGALNIFGLGLVGSYAWRAYENTKQRPEAIVARTLEN